MWTRLESSEPRPHMTIWAMQPFRSGTGPLCNRGTVMRDRSNCRLLKKALPDTSPRAAETREHHRASWAALGDGVLAGCVGDRVTLVAVCVAGPANGRLTGLVRCTVLDATWVATGVDLRCSGKGIVMLKTKGTYDLPALFLRLLLAPATTHSDDMSRRQ